MDLNLSVFQEPRGVMRILHFVFSICAFATITGYTGYVKYQCLSKTESDEYSYPFQFVFTKDFKEKVGESEHICQLKVYGDFSSDAKFFVATGVLAMLYSIVIIVIYAKFDEVYKTNKKIPLYDFLITVIFGVLWLSSSAAWANGLTGLKTATNPAAPTEEFCSKCMASASNFSALNISVIFGFLNFFLWASDLWFLYKETAWFQGKQPHVSDGA